MVTHAAVLAIDAIYAKKAKSLDPTTESASRFVVGSTRHAHMLANGLVTARQSVAPARGPVRFGAVTLGATSSAMSLVHHVPRRSVLPVALMEVAPCPALFLAIGCLARSGAPCR